jgi:hypothetical protein
MQSIQMRHCFFFKQAFFYFHSPVDKIIFEV